MSDWLSPKFGLLLGGVPVALLGWFGVSDVRLLGFSALSWALAGWLFARQWSVWNGGGYEHLWGVSLLLLVAIGDFAIYDGLPLTNGQEFAIKFLLLGLVYASAGIGVEMGRNAASD